MLVSQCTVLWHGTYVVVNIELGKDGGAKTSVAQVGHKNSFLAGKSSHGIRWYGMYVDGWSCGPVEKASAMCSSSLKCWKGVTLSGRIKGEVKDIERIDGLGERTEVESLGSSRDET